jgi:hypothetical protein
MRRDTREHVIGGEEEIVHLEADLPRAVPRRVMDAIAVDDELAVRTTWSISTDLKKSFEYR